MGVSSPLGVVASGQGPYYPNDRANGVVQGALTAIGPGKPFWFWGPFNLWAWGAVNATLTTTVGSVAFSVNSGTGLAAGNAVNSVNVPPGTTIKTFSSTTGTFAMPTVTLWGFPEINTTSGSSVGRIINLPSTTGLLGAAVSGYAIPAGATVLEIVQAAVPGTTTLPPILGIVRISQVPTLVPPVNQPYPYEFALTGNGITVSGADAAASFTGAAITFSATLNIERSFDGGSTWLICNIGGAGTIAQYTAGTPVSLVLGEPEQLVLYRINVIAYTSGTVNYRLSASGGAAMSLAIASPV